MAEDITIGELSRRISSFERHVDKRFDEVKSEVTSLQYVNKEVYTRDLNNVEDRLDKLEEGKQWTQRFVVSAIVLSVIAPVVVSLLLSLLK